MRVFVEEQGVPTALERDVHDDHCPYVLAELDGEAVGAARFRTTSVGFKLERVAVLAAYRGRGIGAAIVLKMLEALPAGAHVYLHAQQGAAEFWRRMGFVAHGPAFVEAGIWHRRMVLASLNTQHVDI